MIYLTVDISMWMLTFYVMINPVHVYSFSQSSFCFLSLFPLLLALCYDCFWFLFLWLASLVSLYDKEEFNKSKLPSFIYFIIQIKTTMCLYGIYTPNLEGSFSEQSQFVRNCFEKKML